MPSSNASVSVVITAYECARYLGQALDSVLAQSRPVQQVIIVDDGSTDGCAEVVRPYADSVKYVRQNNRGSAAARNTGIQHATGDWLALLDGDDYWERNKLADQLAAAGAEPGLEAVFGHVQAFISSDLNRAQAAQLRPLAGPVPGCCCSALLIQRASFLRVGAFDERLRIGEFLEWYGRAVEAGLTVQMLPATLVWRRIHLTNSTRRNRDSRTEYARVLKAMLDRRRSAQSPDGR